MRGPQLSKTEFVEGYLTFDKTADKKTLDEVFAEADEDLNKELSFDETKKAFEIVQKKAKSGPKKTTDALFDKGDSNKDS